MQFRSAIAQLDRWPPPPSSVHNVLPAKYLSGATTLRDVYSRLYFALQDQHYAVTIMHAPNGFALASRIERFDPNTGQSLAEPERWQEQPSITWYDPDFWRKAFFGQNVDTRTFLFVITDQEVGVQTLDRFSKTDLSNWVSSQGVLLPGKVEGKIADRQCLVLVYHFVGRERTFDLTRQTLALETHLRQAGILEKLEAYAIH